MESNVFGNRMKNYKTSNRTNIPYRKLYQMGNFSGNKVKQV